jgi:cytochrome c556
MNRLIRIGAAVTLAAISMTAISQGPPNPDKTAIEARQAVFKLISNQSGAVGAMFRPNGAPFDAAAAARSAERVKVLAGMIPELFARDTRQYKDTPTRALDGIWGAQADFKAKADALATAADALAAAAKSGDKDATQKANTAMGQACGACHDAFRAK